MIIHLEKENFNDLIAKGKVLVDFYAEWCGPCKMMGPVLEEISSKKSDLVIVKVNVDEHPDLAREYGVMSIPSLLYFENGNMVNKHVGYMPSEMLINWF